MFGIHAKRGVFAFVVFAALCFANCAAILEAVGVPHEDAVKIANYVGDVVKSIEPDGNGGVRAHVYNKANVDVTMGLNLRDGFNVGGSSKKEKYGGDFYLSQRGRNEVNAYVQPKEGTRFDVGYNSQDGLNAGGSLKGDKYGVDFHVSQHGPDTLNGYVQPKEGVYLGGRWSSVSGASGTIDIKGKSGAYVHAAIDKQGVTGKAGIQTGKFDAALDLTAHGLIVSADIRPGGAVDTAKLSYNFKEREFGGVVAIKPGTAIDVATIRMALAQGELAVAAELEGKSVSAQADWASASKRLQGNIDIRVEGMAGLVGIPMRTTSKVYDLQYSPNDKVRIGQRGSTFFFEKI